MKTQKNSISHPKEHNARPRLNIEKVKISWLGAKKRLHTASGESAFIIEA